MPKYFIFSSPILIFPPSFLIYFLFPSSPSHSSYFSFYFILICLHTFIHCIIFIGVGILFGSLWIVAKLFGNYIFKGLLACSL